MEERAIFAAGCFWGIEAAFRRLEGVTATRVGYTGGSAESPTYQQVYRGRTGHAEAIEVTFDPESISYQQLLDVFWSSHNPTSRNRQGLNIGSQYRSAIFTHSPAQEAAAQATRATQEANLRWPRRKIATQVEPAGPFYAAEEYHQRYLEKTGRASCTAPLRGTEAARH
jgi:peptide-methionine (S)-S-oxide reductase